MDNKSLSIGTWLKLTALGSPLVAGALDRLARALPRRASEGPVADVVFVTPPKPAQGWILDAICREIGTRLPGLDVRYCAFGTPLPASRRYFFSHYMYYVGSLSRLRPFRLGQSHVFATHLEASKHGVSDEMLARLLNTSDSIICMNDALRDRLASLGVEPNRLSVSVGAASAAVYRPHPRRADGKVGFCSAYYPRKSPDLVLEVVRAMPHRKFVLLGKGWDAYPRFAELCALPNFELVDTTYEHYPAFYAQMSVFISASQLEGGPIPLLEAMMSNAVPVASRTGFAPDVIEHGKNGFLFDIGTPAAQVCALVERAFELDCAVDETVRHCDWVPYAAKIADRMGIRAPQAAITALKPA